VPCAIKAETAGNDLNAMELTARAESDCEANLGSEKKRALSDERAPGANHGT